MLRLKYPVERVVPPVAKKSLLRSGLIVSASTFLSRILGMIRDIIIARYDYMKTTVIATNLDCEEFLRQYGERVMDRITEAYTSIYFSGDSYRRRSLGR